jgi:hypothetical protein
MKNWSKSFFSPAIDKGHRVRLWAASLIAGLLLLTLGFTSGVLAVAHDHPTVFFACVNNNSGTIHMTTAGATCPGNEQKISWNQPGSQANPGPTGPKDDREPSDGFAATFIGSGGGIIIFNTGPADFQPPTQIVALSLPAGNYLLNAFVNLETFSAGEDVVCDLNGGAGESGHLTADDIMIPPNSKSTMSLTHVLNTYPGGTVKLECELPFGNVGDEVAVPGPLNIPLTGTADTAQLTAVQVGTLH